MYLTQTAQHPEIYCHPFQHISLQTNNTKESLTAEIGLPFPHLRCNRRTQVRIGSLFLILQLPNIISTIRSNNQHQRFIQQILPKPQTLLTTDHIRSATFGHVLTRKSRSTTHLFAKHSINYDVIRQDRHQLSFPSSSSDARDVTQWLCRVWARGFVFRVEVLWKVVMKFVKQLGVTNAPFIFLESVC